MRALRYALLLSYIHAGLIPSREQTKNQALHDFVNKRVDGDVGEALVSFFQWMSKYDRLFQDPCKIANKLVATDSSTGEPLPPTMRTTSGDALFPQSLAGVPQRPIVGEHGAPSPQMS